MKKIVLDKTAFVRHPVLPELKRKLNNEGYQIVDAAFAPEGETVIDGSPAPGAAASPVKPKAAAPAKQTAKPDEDKVSASEALALASGNFMAFKSAAKKVLGDAMPAKKPEIVAALEALAGSGEPVSELPDGTPTPVPDAWEAMTDDELLELAAALSGGPVTASGDQQPVERARSIIQATVDDRASRAH